MRTFDKEVMDFIKVSKNPYIDEECGQVRMYGTDEIRYLWGDTVCTKSELDEEYRVIAQKDIMYGYKDRIAGYYDKWYRYHHLDNGAAYDYGAALALKEKNCSDSVYIIEGRV